MTTGYGHAGVPDLGPSAVPRHRMTAALQRLGHHQWHVLGAALAVAALAVAWPLQDDWAYDSFVGRYGISAAIVAATLAVLVRSLARHREIDMAPPTLRTDVVAALVIPAALLVWWAVSLRQTHATYDTARSTFAAYTHRFPAGKLGVPYIEARDGARVALCAREHHAAHGRQYFCTTIDTTASPHHRVIGGWTAYYQRGGDLNLHEHRTGCFGVVRSTCPRRRRPTRGYDADFKPGGDLMDGGFRPGG